MADHTRGVDIPAIAAAALERAEQLVPRWLRGGKKEGHEWVCGNLRGDAGHSCRVNLAKGAWADFAGDDKGGDLVSLYAAMHGLSQLEAAKAVAGELGLALEPAARSRPLEQADPVLTPEGVALNKRGRSGDWEPLLPVPVTAGPAPIAHLKRGKASAWWDYFDAEGRLLGRIARFTTSDGGKEVLPFVYARHRTTGAEAWRNLSFPEPRPLYGLQHLARPDDHERRRLVLVVEGEKCAANAHALLGDRIDVVSWPGGGKAVTKADWRPLADRRVVIWPDCDAKKLKDSDTLLPEDKQPGIVAAETVAELLLALGCNVRLVKIPAPGLKPDGWDIADAIAEGWTADQLRAFIAGNLRHSATVESAPDPRGARASDEGPRDWRKKILFSEKGAPRDCRENVITVLLDHPAWRGALRFDEFGQRIVARKPTPIGQAPGHVWTADDDVELGRWLATELAPVRSLETISVALGYVAKRERYHPVREYLRGLTWDEQPRVDAWACRLLGCKDTPYHRLVGRYFLVNMVRRVLDPGCVMRSVPVLEGRQNKGKSTALKLLAAPWYSDTMFKVGDKDAYLLIQGVWLYEISELESFNRSEATAVKAFISSTVDNFRAPYEAKPEKHPRQTVFAASTNAHEYLKDWTGGTRFWPLRVGDTIDLEGIARERDQLLAEAYALHLAGARSYPTNDEYALHFEREQDERQVVHPWVETIVEFTEGLSRDYVTVRELMTDALKMDIARVQFGGGDAQRVGQIMQTLGWEKRRASEGSRPWQWVRPKPQREPNGVQEREKALGTRVDDDIPF